MLTYVQNGKYVKYDIYKKMAADQWLIGGGIDTLVF